MDRLFSFLVPGIVPGVWRKNMHQKFLQKVLKSRSTADIRRVAERANPEMKARLHSFADSRDEMRSLFFEEITIEEIKAND